MRIVFVILLALHIYYDKIKVDDITDLDNNHDGVADYILKHFL